MQKEKKPSEIIQEFLEFLKYCDKEYKDCVTQVYKQRNDRRAMKDRVEFVEKVAKFCADRQNKQFIDRLKSLLAQQERAEQYVLSERHYNRRGEIANDTN